MHRSRLLASHKLYIPDDFRFFIDIKDGDEVILECYEDPITKKRYIRISAVESSYVNIRSK